VSSAAAAGRVPPSADSRKIVVTSSATARCTSRSSVMARLIATSQARDVDALSDSCAGVDQQARRGSFLEPVLAQRAHLLAQRGEIGRGLEVDAAFVRDDARLELGRRIVELERDEALPRRGLEVLENTLVARVVRDDEQEVLVRLEARRPLRSAACTMIGERWTDRGVAALRRSRRSDRAGAHAPRAVRRSTVSSPVSR
jgi:hypothetical protein